MDTLVRYQLVLQWSGSSFEDYDEMIELEELISEALPNESELDGHDVGMDQVNIFIHTGRPETTFALIRPVLSVCNRLRNARAAFRELSGDEYTILWPSNLKAFEIA